MLFENFVEQVEGLFNQYLSFVRSMQKQGRLQTDGGVVLYPKILLATKCSGHYIVELVGASRNFSKLVVKKRKSSSVYEYLSQFDNSEPESLFHLDGEKHTLRGLCLAQQADFEALKDRFPTIELYDSKVKRAGGAGSVLSFGDNFKSCGIENSVLVNRSGELYRCKNILSSYIFSKSVSNPYLVDFFKEKFKQESIVGVHVVKGEYEERVMVAGQLQSMFLFPSLHETTIGEFLKLHPEIIKKSFKTEHFEYEPYMEWVEHEGDIPDKAINPDLMICRDDGYFDIYDLKTAALNKKSLTKGKEKRRRFIDYVNEGIAQLAHYRDYFSYKKNAEHAFKKYGIQVSNPKLVLVVGSWENYELDEVKQAVRAFGGVEVIDYDTFCQQFIGAE